jgi:hypothetical protein
MVALTPLGSFLGPLNQVFASAVLETPKLETDPGSSGGVQGPQWLFCLCFILLRDCSELPGHGPRGIARPGLCGNQKFLRWKSMAFEGLSSRA